MYATESAALLFCERNGVRSSLSPTERLRAVYDRLSTISKPLDESHIHMSIEPLHPSLPPMEDPGGGGGGKMLCNLWSPGCLAGKGGLSARI